MWWFSLTCASGRNQQILLQWIPERKFRNVICVEGLLHKSCMSEIIAFTGTILGFKMYRFSLLTIGTIAWLQGMIFKILSIIGFDDCLKQYPHWKKKLSKAEGGELATVFKSDWPSALQTTLRQLLSIDCRARLRASETVSPLSEISL